jgi:hypothetical protein
MSSESVPLFRDKDMRKIESLTACRVNPFSGDAL